MAQTLFYVPVSLFGLPLFGFGSLLALVLVVGGAALLWQLRRGWSPEVQSTALLIAFLSAGVVFLLPAMVEFDTKGEPLGAPIRGFGVMMMLATIAGVGLSAYRAQQVGLDPEIIYSLAFWMFLGGILGARGFYVLQYWHEYFQPGRSLVATLQAVLNAAKGGLVVYGGLIGGLGAAIWFVRERKLSFLTIADIIAPGMAVGQAIGRIGCFLNGCCYGGLCALPLVATSFPQTSNPSTGEFSPPYGRQKELGWLYGFELTKQPASSGDEQLVISHVDEIGPAAQAGLKTGDVITGLNGFSLKSLAITREQLLNAEWKEKEIPDSEIAIARRLLVMAGPAISLQTADGRVLEWSQAELPARSLPIHPTQLYAFVDAGLLAFFLWSFFPFRRRDGEVFALLITLHPISRFLLELIRIDEPGLFGSSLTISQWLSLAILALAAGLWVYVERQRDQPIYAPHAA